MKKSAITLVSVLLLTSVLYAQDNARTGSSQKPFAAGGHIRMQLSASDYEIRSGSNDRIVVSWSVPGGRSASANIEVKGTDAVVTTDGPSNNSHFLIEVPRTSDLSVNLSAGDLKLGPISGNKTIEMGAGDLNIKVPSKNDYGRVDISLAAGDLNAKVFDKATGGLFRSFHWTGPGKYSLQIHLRAGDINITEPETI